MPTLTTASATVSAVTAGNLSVTLPSYIANDIVVVTVMAWVPNTATGANTIATPSGWNKYTPAVTRITGGLIDAEFALFWARATSTSSLGTSVTFTRPTGWDTGADTCWAGRGQGIRDCITVGNPWDAINVSPIFTTTNATVPSIAVLGNNRNIFAFFIASDNNNTSFTQSSTYGTTGGAFTNTGTDAGFATYIGPLTSSSELPFPLPQTAPAQGGYVYFVASFAPLPVVSSTATGSGLGSETATGNIPSVGINHSYWGTDALL